MCLIAREAKVQIELAQHVSKGGWMQCPDDDIDRLKCAIMSLCSWKSASCSDLRVCSIRPGSLDSGKGGSTRPANDVALSLRNIFSSEIKAHHSSCVCTYAQVAYLSICW